MTAETAIRSGRARRGTALLIDLVLVVLLMQAIAMSVFRLADGRAQLSRFGVGATHCEPIPRLPAGAAMPGSFEAKSLRLCSKSLFGQPFRRWVEATQSERPDEKFREPSVVWRVDASDRFVRVMELSPFVFPALILLRLLFDLRARTPGRFVMEIAVAPASAPDARPTPRALVIRALVFAAPFLVAACAEAADAFVSIELDSVVTFGETLGSLAWFAAGIAVLIGRDAFYDLVARTRVVPRWWSGKGS